MEDVLILKIRLTSFFLIDSIGKEYISELKKEITANKPFSLNIENWEKNKELFKKQRFDKLQKGLTDIEKADKEIKDINYLLSKIESLNLSFYKKEAFQTLANRYLNYLKKKDIETTSTLAPLPVNNTQKSTRILITDLFNNIHVDGFKRVFRSENDYNRFVNILVNHFESKEYDLPKDVIQLKQRSKTILAATLGKIHSELSHEDIFKNDVKYFDIVKCLSPYEKLTDTALYKTLTRDR